MWCYLEEIGSLVQCLLHHPVLLQVEIEHGLLKVANSTVDQLSATTAGTR